VVLNAHCNKRVRSLLQLTAASRGYAAIQEGEAHCTSMSCRATKRPSSHSGIEWRWKVGKAIDVLRSDAVASATEQGEQDFSIFSQDVVLDVAQMPQFQVHGLDAYRRAMNMIRWSTQSAFERYRVEVLSVTPPAAGVVYMRWRVHLWPIDPLAPARQFLAPLLSWDNALLYRHHHAEQAEVVDGYSRYEFDPWSAEIIRHTIDFKNPPSYLTEMLRSDSAGVPAFQMGGVPPPVRR